ncbi:MAG: biotin transporter BioY [Pyramidobacter sp.]|jgi:biotin transport system substrate-specific component
MKQKIDTVELTKMALLTALICVSSYIAIPLPFTPARITGQTLVVNLIALLLTPRQAALTMVVYILLGLTGLPVFSGAMGGPGKLFGPTGGYIMSWIPAVILMSRLKGEGSFKRYCLVTVLVGMPVIYLIGSAYMKFVTGMDWTATFTAAVIPFIPLDIFKCFAAALIAKPVQIILSNAQRTRSPMVQ